MTRLFSSLWNTNFTLICIVSWGPKQETVPAVSLSPWQQACVYTHTHVNVFTDVWCLRLRSFRIIPWELGNVPRPDFFPHRKNKLELIIRSEAFILKSHTHTHIRRCLSMREETHAGNAEHTSCFPVVSRLVASGISCVCVCVCGCMYTHTHTHTFDIYTQTFIVVTVN